MREAHPDRSDGPSLLYYVMPCVAGETLRQRLEREGRLPVAAAIRIVREVALALAYAHRHGVIHRDIKPENILFEDDHAVVADFGIATAMESAGSDRLTETGLAVGTPAYMSPEQAGGEADSAVKQLRFLLTVPSWISFPGLRADPTWGPIRRDPAFQALLESGE